MCRSVLCPVSGTAMVALSTAGHCVNGTHPSYIVPAQPITTASESSTPRGDSKHDHDHDHHHDTFDRCPKFLLEPFEFELADDGQNATVMAYAKTFVRGEFRVTDDGKLEICAYNFGDQLIDKFGPYMG